MLSKLFCIRHVNTENLKVISMKNTLLTLILYTKILILLNCDTPLVITNEEKIPSDISIVTTPSTGKFDEKFNTTLYNCGFNNNITIHCYQKIDSITYWHSKATFHSDNKGVIDFSIQAPISGSYNTIDPMGLVWSMTELSIDSNIPAEVQNPTEPYQYCFTVESNNTVVAFSRYTITPFSEYVTFTELDSMPGYLALPINSNGKLPVAILLHGSGGPNEIQGWITYAAALANNGFASIIPIYFGVEGQKPTLNEIPVETVSSYINHIKTINEIDSTKIGVIGGSKGGELALLAASKYPDIKLVVSYVGSGATIHCYGTSSWSFAGQPYPDFYRDGDTAIIKVENINGPIILISGGDDGVWDSKELQELAYNRLKENNHIFTFKHLIYENAGHGISIPYLNATVSSGKDAQGNILYMGGSPASNAEANENSWNEIIQLLNETF